jgi:hypothetical protein
MRTRAIAASLLLLSLIAVRDARAEWPNDPTRNLIVARNAAIQPELTAIASDGAGGAYIAWTTSSYTIMAQHVGAGGAMSWGAGGITVATASGSRGSVALDRDGSGGVVIAWVDTRTGTTQVYAQRYDAAGAAQWTTNGIAVAPAAGTQTTPKVACGPTTAYLVWVDQRNGNMDIYAQGLLANGSRTMGSGGWGVCAAANEQSMPVIAVGADDFPVMVWRDFRNGNWDIYALKSYNSGASYYQTTVCQATGTQTSPRLALDSFGAPIIAWQDQRSGNYDIYAQRLNTSGIAQWTADGIALCTASNTQGELVLCSDGLNGVIIAWSDQRNPGDADIYVQRVSALGTVLWTANGVQLCNTGGNQTVPQIVADGANGAIVGWLDARYGTASEVVFAQRILATGYAGWSYQGTATPVAVSTFGERHIDPQMAIGGDGGAILCGSTSSYALWVQRVDTFGKLGAEPVLTAVADVPNDEGGQVKVSWRPSPLDSLPYAAIDDYVVYRSVPPNVAAQALRAGATLAATSSAAGSGRRVLVARADGATAGYWEAVGTVTANHLPGYSFVAATLADSAAAGAPPTKFMVEARTQQYGTQWWFSAPDSGYSVDDLAPAAPTPFTGAYGSGVTALNWGASAAADLAGYRLYRGATPGFAPGPASLVASTTETSFADAPGGPCFYRLCAVDIHGNVSPYAFLQPTGTTDAPGALPRELALSAPAPNPLRARTTLRLALPRAAHVALAVLDAQGRRVRTLLAGAQPAGDQAITWDGRDDAGRRVADGIYVVRLACEGRVITRRIAALR